MKKNSHDAQATSGRKAKQKTKVAKQPGVTQVAREFRCPSGTTRDAIQEYYSALDTPVSLSCWLLFESGEHLQLAKKGVNPLDYADLRSFRDDLAAVSLLEKAEFLKTGVDLKSVALAKFDEAEAQCSQTNSRLRCSRPVGEKNTLHYEHLLSMMSHEIQSLIDVAPDLEVVFGESGWGPGVTTLVKGHDTSAYNKFRQENGITASLYPLHMECYSSMWPTWDRESGLSNPSNLIKQEGGQLTTVSKNAKSDRTILIEPGLNSWYQKGIGRFLRRRLKRWGVMLDDQGRNQELARLGSKTGLIATIDLRAASDTIASALVRELLPYEWYDLLNNARSHSVCVSGQDPRYLSKFSTMGNGFTFELESLIFASAVKAVLRYYDAEDEQWGVYGDDICLPTRFAAVLEGLFGYLGFTFNVEKTHVAGYYRESCGAHFWNGTDVKPIFLKGSISNAFSLYSLHNSVVRLAHRMAFNAGRDTRFHTLCEKLNRTLPGILRQGISEGFGDGGLIMDIDEAAPQRARRGFEGHYARALSQVGVTYHAEESAMLLARLYGLSSEIDDTQDELGGLSRVYHKYWVLRTLNLQHWIENPELTREPTTADSNSVTLRRVTKITAVSLLVADWYFLGPWLRVCW